VLGGGAGHGRLGEPAVDLAGLVVPLAGRLAGCQGWGGSRAGCLIAVAWLLRQPEDAITVPELAGLYRSARR
jgi:hypothetical protein